jgi:hypothetical protein
MNYPYLNEMKTKRRIIDNFRGYNHNLKIARNEFFDMKNMTSASFPLLSPRDRRGIYASPEKTRGLIAKDALCYVDGSKFVMNEYEIDMGLSDETPKRLVSMGAYVIIFPDKKYINTKDITDFGNIEAEYSSAEGQNVSFELCRVDGSAYKDVVVSSSEPSTPVNLDLWIDTSSEPHTLKQYSEASGIWVSIATTYIKISAPGIGKAFETYDGVNISGVENENLKDLNASIVIQDKGDDFIVVTGLLDAGGVVTQTSPITIKRELPLMDFVTEANNRLWGCRYGVARNGKVVNEIYASKLGDFKNWNCFSGISTDSYAASVGSDGQFTGAVTHNGYPIFFKEDCIHKIYGTEPSNFQIQNTIARGVQKGSSDSLAIVNEVLYYKTKNGICAFDGSFPVEISEQFGEEKYFEAVGGAHGNKYYVSMKDSEGKANFFVFDTAKKLWHREDETDVLDFCSCNNELYFIDKKDGKIKTVFGSGSEESEPVEWMVETGVLSTDSPDKKYISRLTVRMSLEIGSDVSFFVQYDSAGAWVPLASMTGTSLRSFAIPLRPKRCDHFRLRIVGEGEAKIFSFAETIEEGSDMF